MRHRVFALLLAALILCAALPTAAAAEGTDPELLDPTLYLDYAAGIEAGVYRWFAADDGSYYYLAAANENGEPLAETLVNYFSPTVSFEKTQLTGVYTAAAITNTAYQTMVVYVPAEYGVLNDNGTLTIREDAVVNGYTPATAPIIFENNNAGWNSGTTNSCNTDYMQEGFVYVTCGSRSRDAMDESGLIHTGKAPTPVVDLKAGVIALRANAAILPGDTEKIISLGTSGGGQMSSLLGASGDMAAYFPYLYEIGALGVTKEGDSYASRYKDSVYAAMCFCPIADIDNADLAYAWMRYDSTLSADGSQDATAGSYAFTPFQLRLQELEAEAFVDYINGLGLKDADGTVLTLDGLRAGNYYELVLRESGNALNAFAAGTQWPYTEASRGGMGGPMMGDRPVGETGPAQKPDGAAGFQAPQEESAAVYQNMDEYVAAKYPDSEAWLVKTEDGSYQITDLAGFITGTGLTRNKNIPGFDAPDLSAENNAFGPAATDAVHYSASIAQLMRDHYEELSALADETEQEQLDAYIENALDGPDAPYIAAQTALMNGTHILLDGAAAPAKFFRTRNGTADQHTSFTVALNICLAAEMAGLDADYALVWNMQHGNNEGDTTGTFIDWVNSIC